MGLITGPTFTSAGGGQRESQRLEESERLDMKDTLLAGFEVEESVREGTQVALGVDS